MLWGRRFVSSAIRRSPQAARAVGLALPLALTGALICTPACTRSGGVERLEDGRRDVGRLVPPAAYAAYAAGLEHEAGGRLAAARRAYDDARRLDPESGAAWAALGRVTCVDSPAEALRTFELGLERAAERLPLFLARASCLTSLGEFERALPDARAALGLAPGLPRATDIYADILAHLGREDEADLARRALDIYRRRKLDLTTDSNLAAVDQALSSGDFALAERLSTGLIGKGQLALRALALGRAESARSLAALVLAAEPDSADAAVVLLISGPTPELLSAEAPPKFGALSALGRCLLTEHLVAHASAAAWTPERESEPAPLAPDPLLSTCRARIAGARTP